ncbi:hypothetical protein [Phytohabitans rumicis]|uniref:Uncharacterized protein n=1 Tax=Phytohabitans rumicis TaxID=1076125 RepID=A0A6V8LNX0_9ACTN|nr:hypothetical protein [Phytohabitans rumicis]GFJ96349.1 hypothetical protein Prum_099910 [Phytohabitans rumicis]
MSAGDDERDGNPYRRLPPRIRPTGSEQDVTPPQAVPEVRSTNPFSPAGQVEAYGQMADFAIRTPKRDWRRTLLLAVLALGPLVLLALWLTEKL